jgi:hypothetical protein
VGQKREGFGQAHNSRLVHSWKQVVKGVSTVTSRQTWRHASTNLSVHFRFRFFSFDNRTEIEIQFPQTTPVLALHLSNRKKVRHQTGTGWHYLRSEFDDMLGSIYGRARVMRFKPNVDMERTLTFRTTRGVKQFALPPR